MAVEYRLGQQFRFVPGRRILERIPETENEQAREITLPARALDLLAVLVRERHRAVSKDHLNAEVWNGISVTPNNLNQCVTALRKALGDTRQAPRYIATIPNVGYQFVAPVVERNAEPGTAPAVPTDPAKRADPATPKRSRRRILLALGLLFAALLIASRWYPSFETHDAIAAAPFENLQKDEDFEWLGRACSEFVISTFAPPMRNSRHTIRGTYAIPAPEQIQIRLSILEREGGRRIVGTAEGTDSLAAFPELLRNLATEAGQAAGLPLLPRNTAPDAFAEGVEAWRQGNLPLARVALRRAVSLNPRLPQSLSALGAVLLELGHTAEARTLQHRAMQLLRESATVQQHPEIEGRYFVSRGEWTQGIPGLSAQWTKHPDQTHHALELAYAQFRATQTDAAARTLQALARLHPQSVENPRILLLNARLQGQYGNMAQVRDLAARAVSAARGAKLLWVEGRALLLQAGAAQNLGAYAEATRLRLAAVQLCRASGDGPCLATARRIEGNLYLGLGQIAEAVQCYRATLQQSSQDGNLHERLQAINGMAHALMRNSQYREAEALFRTALQRDVAFAGLLPEAVSNSLAEALLAQGLRREARAEAQRAMRFATSSGDRETLARACLLAAEAGGTDPEAEAYFEQAIEQFRHVGNPEQSRLALLQYARYLQARGKRTRAGQQVKEASRLPTDLHRDLLSAIEASLARTNN